MGKFAVLVFAFSAALQSQYSYAEVLNVLSSMTYCRNDSSECQTTPPESLRLGFYEISSGNTITNWVSSYPHVWNLGTSSSIEVEKDKVTHNYKVTLACVKSLEGNYDSDWYSEMSVGVGPSVSPSISYELRCGNTRILENGNLIDIDVTFKVISLSVEE